MIPGEYECGRDFRMRQVNSSSCKWEGIRKLGMHDSAVYGDDVKAAKKRLDLHGDVIARARR